ncbi:hypothetical protein RRG08_027676 [Elysia crispata]|uniref:Uncharacterized protein n=1 Tax=Elysia crispata TaxID=231223 RepID=A0AAE0XM67_9GAST|nr:hypothetical protein RRG08_027676 [Elysia crispata]
MGSEIHVSYENLLKEIYNSVEKIQSNTYCLLLIQFFLKKEFSEKVHKNSWLVARDSEKVHKNSWLVARDSEKVHKNSWLVARDSEKVHKNSWVVTRDSEKCTKIRGW